MAKILIIEDDALLSKMYYSIFTARQYEVEAAVDGEEGIEKARATKPTLILLDVMMPKLNGIQVLQKLKDDPELGDIPVVILTNLAGDYDVQTALQMGAVRYIIKSETKPAQVEEIVREIIAGYTRNDVPAA